MVLSSRRFSALLQESMYRNSAPIFSMVISCRALIRLSTSPRFISSQFPACLLVSAHRSYRSSLKNSTKRALSSPTRMSENFFEFCPQKRLAKKSSGDPNVSTAHRWYSEIFPFVTEAVDPSTKAYPSAFPLSLSIFRRVM